jgi:sugar/nucleoside kinase (ribokinase family)
MARKVWVQGPIAIDSVVYLSKFPVPGSFMNSLRTEERTGGSSANVALGLCTASVETGFVCYLGRDDNGRKLRSILEQSQIKDLVITEIDGPTSNALILVDNNSERTIISMTTPYLRQLRMDNVPLKAGEIVAFILWREEFLNDLVRAQSEGCFTVVGAGALADPHVKYADLLIGSRNDFSSSLHIEDHLHRFSSIVLTDGMNGSVLYGAGTEIHQPAYKVEVKDTTGAGDAFIAGYLSGIAHALTPTQSMEIAAKWATSAVQFHSSVPPAFDVVKEQWGLDLIP